MYKPNWRVFILAIVLLALLVFLSGCQVARNLDQTTRAISSIPSRLGQAIVNMMSGIGNIGNALANQVGNIIHNMTGR